MSLSVAAGLARASYFEPATESEENLRLMRRIELFLRPRARG
jgi:hypothetical protein